MNCEMAEDNLSAYLDDMLDSQARADVQEHLDGCTRCHEILDDYRRYDILLAQLPLVAPPDDMHARIFESPQFLAIAREQHRDRQRAGRRLAIAPPGWAKIALQAAAVVVLAVGAALLIKQGLFSSARPTSSTSTSTIGNPGPTGIPLAAGNRLIFVHANGLWSAPETGAGLAQQLTPHGISVAGAGFAVSPDGHHVAYVDSDGAIHVIRSDGQGDTTIVQGHGAQILRAPVWSPDGQQLAYVVNSLNGAALHLINSSGTNDRIISTTNAGAISQFGSVRWSPDGLHVAWVQTTSGESLWTYDLVARATHQLAAHADPANPSASFVDLAWLHNSLQPALTWAADTLSPPTATGGSARSTITGVFTLPLSSGTVRRLSASGATYSGALYTAARGDGAWLLISGGSASTLEAVAGDSGAVLGSTAISTSARTGFWSPDGGSVAYVTSAGDLALWSPASGVTQHLLSGVTSVPAWSQDGSHLAAVTSNGIESVAVGTTGAPRATHLANAPAQGPVAAFWAPDGRAVVVTSPSGLLIVTSDGSQSRVIAQGIVTGTLAWSVAG